MFTDTRMSYRDLCVVYVTLFWCPVTLGQDYCQVCPDHTMCIYKGDGEACRPKLASGVGSKEIQGILDVHNYYRRRLVTGQERRHPFVSDVLEVAWDDELARIAQRWADQCTYSHDKCRDLPNARVGQNTRQTRSKRADLNPEWNGTITSWYRGVSLRTSRRNQRPFRRVKGGGGSHCTHVLWADTSAVGCGYSVYPKSHSIEKLYVCNYAPRDHQGTLSAVCPSGSTYRDGVETVAPPDTPTCWPGEVLYNGECLGYNDIVMAFKNAISKICFCNS